MGNRAHRAATLTGAANDHIAKIEDQESIWRKQMVGSFSEREVSALGWAVDPASWEEAVVDQAGKRQVRSHGGSGASAVQDTSGSLLVCEMECVLATSSLDRCPNDLLCDVLVFSHAQNFRWPQKSYSGQQASVLISDTCTPTPGRTVKGHTFTSDGASSFTSAKAMEETALK